MSRDGSRSYSPSEFTTGAGAESAQAQSIRDAVAHTGPLDGLEIYTVRVLTKPMPLQPGMSPSMLGDGEGNAITFEEREELEETQRQEAIAEIEEELAEAEAAADFGAIIDVATSLESRAELLNPEGTSAAQATSAGNLADTISAGAVPPTNRFYFKGRLEFEGLDAALTLMNFHNMLPDPCNLPLTVAPHNVLRILSFYPTFVSKVGYDGKIPSVGELVEVHFNQGEFGISGQFNVFNELTEPQSQQSENLLASQQGCSTLQSLFGDHGVASAGSVEMGYAGPELVPGELGVGTNDPNTYIAESDGVETHRNSRPSTNPENVVSIPGVTVINQLAYPLGRIHPRSYPKTNWQGIVLHYTADHEQQPGVTPQAARTLRRRGLSYHFVITQAGEVNQFTDLGDLCQAHPGKNGTHLGISFVNLGFDRPAVSRHSGDWPVPTGPHPNPSGKSWEPYPPAQIQAAVATIRFLISQFPSITAEQIIRHEDVDSGKSDTGPALNLNEIRRLAFS